MSSYTAARRSNVIHIINDAPDLGSASFTACGRRIGDDWQGEYDEAPIGPATCKRCAAHEATAQQRQACMDRHPAGKGRTAPRFATQFPNGFRVRRLTPVSDELAVIMGARPLDGERGGYEYVIGLLTRGASEWVSGRYFYSAAQADELFRSRVSRLFN